MDLYIQVGVILLFLAALSLFVYFYTQPAQQFTEGINNTTKELNQRLETASGVNLNQYFLNSNVSGAQVKKLIQDAEASKIGVLVHTKEQKGLLVNYGYQLRNNMVTVPEMVPNGKAGTVSTDFEKSYVSTYYSAVLAWNYQNPQTILEVTRGFNPGGAVYTLTQFQDPSFRLNNAISNKTNNLNNTIAERYKFPLIAEFPREMTALEAATTGNYTLNTGLLYTPDIIREDFSINKNYTYMNNNSSAYYIDRKAQFNTTLIVGVNDKIVGVYVEEHGLHEDINYLQTAINGFKN